MPEAHEGIYLLMFRACFVFGVVKVGCFAGASVV
jgi:hypothetical protein